MDNFAAIKPVLDAMSAEELISAGEYIFHQLKKQPLLAAAATRPAKEVETALSTTPTSTPSPQNMTNIREPPQLTDGDASNEEQPFRFFDLPRELRDWCYDYMNGPTVKLTALRERDEFDNAKDVPDAFPDSEKVVDRIALETAIRAPPLVNVLCVSREVKSEYEQRCFRKTTLMVYDHDENVEFQDFDPDAYHIPNLDWVVRAQYLGMVQCHLIGIQCTADTLAAKEWIEAAVGHLRNLHSVHICLVLQCQLVHADCEWPAYAHAVDIQSSLQDIVENDFVATLDVYRCEQGLITVKEVPDEDLLYVRWTKKDGWVAPKSTEDVRPEASLAVEY